MANCYMEKFKVGLEDAGPGFNPAAEIRGEEESNLIFINAETGADVTVRGRGSGFIEPRTGRESLDFLHVLVQHNSSLERFNQACSLVRDLIETVKEDWQKFKAQQCYPGGSTYMDFYWQDNYIIQQREIQQRLRDSSCFREDKSDDEESEDGDMEEKKRRKINSLSEFFSKRFTSQGDVREMSELTHSQDSWVDSIKESPYCDTWQPRDVSNDSWSRSQMTKDQDVRGKKLKEDRVSAVRYSPGEPPTCSRLTQSSQWQDNRWNEDKDSNQTELLSENTTNMCSTQSLTNKNSNGSEKVIREWAEKRIAWARNEKKKMKNENSNKVSRWDTLKNDPTKTSDKNVLGIVLDQKIEIEERLEKCKSMKVEPFVKDGSDPAHMSVEGVVNPFKLTKEQLQGLNHEQLLEVSQKQQELLMNLAVGLLKQQSSLSNLVPPNNFLNFQVNPTMPVCPVPPPISTNEMTLPIPPPPPPPILSEIMLDQDKYSVSDLKNSPMNHKQNHLSLSFNKDRLNRNHCLYNDSGNMKDLLRPMTSKDGTDKFSRGGKGNLYPAKDVKSVTPCKDSFPTYFKGHSSSSFAKDSKYSPRPKGGQERYSPQLEDDCRSNRNTDYSRKEMASKRSADRDDTLSMDSSHKRQLRMRVAVMDKNLRKLTSADEIMIRKLVFDHLNLLPIDKTLHIDFNGLASQDRLFVLAPRSLDGMKWLLNLKSLLSKRYCYLLFPYEDVYNRYRMKTMLYLDLLEGYQPNSDEVIMELGRLNTEFSTHMWKKIMFHEESLGFFLMLSVDHLSYLQIKKLQWKLRYRTGFIRLEPV